MVVQRCALLLLAAVISSDAKAVQEVTKPNATKAAIKAARFRQVNTKALARALSMTESNPPLTSGTDACAAFTSEAQCQDNTEAHQDGCVWALPHGNSADWEDEEDEVCRPMRCHDIESQQMSGDEALGCATFLGNGHCTFNEDAYVCWETGQPLDCEFTNAWEESMCPSPRCNWNANLYRCTTAGAAEVCGEYYDSAGCNGATDCSWVAGDADNGCSVCYNSTRFRSGAPCEAYFVKVHACCPTDGCVWDVVMAPETDIPGEVGDGDGRCVTPGQDLACSQYEDNGDCTTASDRCHWVSMGSDGYGFCIGNGLSVPCTDLDGYACTTTDTCLWTAGTTEEPDMDDVFDGACSDCPSGQSCHQDPLPTPDTPGGGGTDDGRPCDQHTEANCPVEGIPPRCSVHFPNGFDDGGDTDYNDWQCSQDVDSDGVCGAPMCEDAYESSECSGMSGCAWNQGCEVCYNSSTTKPCDRCYDSGSCGGFSGCQWQTGQSGCSTGGDDGACVATGQQIPCKSINAETAACCPSHCTFDSSTLQCKDPGSAGRNCESYGGDLAANTGCPMNRCGTSKGICVQQGTSLQCSDICNSFLCGSSGDCHWDGSGDNGGTCLDGAGQAIVCSSLSEDNCYSNEQCAFIGGSCQDGVCSDIFSEDVCGARSSAPYNCVWHDATGCYFADDQLPCSHYYDDATCPSDRCHYDSSCFRCMDTGEVCPCHYFYQQNDCPSDRCNWIANQYTCELKSEESTPNLSGNGDHDKDHCTSTQKGSLGAVLDAALDDCEDFAGATTATADQLKCLDYYLKHASPPTTFEAACPCLYYWAQHVDPERGYWMALNC